MRLSDYKDADVGWVRRVPILLAGATEPVDVGVVPILPPRKAELYRDAKADARAMGVEKWDDQDRVCQLMLDLRTVEAGAVDVEVDGENPPQWATLEELRTNRRLGDVNIAILAEQQREHERSRAVRIDPLTPEGFQRTVAAVLEGPADADPLGSLPRSTLESFARTMVAQYNDLMLGTLRALQLSDSAGQDSGETKSASELIGSDVNPD